MPGMSFHHQAHLTWFGSLLRCLTPVLNFFRCLTGLVIAAALPLAAAAQKPALVPTPARVAAAANLQPALTELVQLFERGQSGKVVLNFGSSANLVRQIQQGLPADLFLSADEDFAWRLADAGLTPDRGVVYATGRLVLLVPAQFAWSPDSQLASLQPALAQIEKFAIANPELAPYGRAAVQALQKSGVWTALQPRLVLGENIAQTTQYVSSGAAQAGITALSLALSPEVAARTRHAVIDEAFHAPLRQRMVLLNSAGPVARAFFDFMQSAQARSVLTRHGYR